MKIIYEIARVQLSKLFYSPIVWLVIIVIFIQVGYYFAANLEFFETRLRQTGTLMILTERLYTFTSGSLPGIFYVLSQTLYLYIPLLTMGLFSSELSTGSIKLVYSSPVTTFQLVLGKFLPMLFLSLIIISTLWLFVIPGFFLVKDLDLGVICSATIGVFLLACAYSAVGLFLSSLSGYQIVVAISTFVILGFLNFVGKLWQTIPYLSELAFWLSMPDRANDFINGLFKSHNLIYFILISTLFLGLTVLHLTFYKKGTTKSKRLVGYVALTLIIVVIGYVSSLPSNRIFFDFTQSKRRTLSKNSQEVINQMTESDIKITAYANVLDGNVLSSLPKRINADKRKFEEYQRFKPQMSFEYIYFYDTVSNNPAIFNENKGLSIDKLAEVISGSYGLDFDKVLRPTDVREVVDLSNEDNQYIRKVDYNGKSTFLRMFDGFRHFPQETQITAALKSLIKGKQVVAFSSGHGERSFNKSLDERAYYLEFATKHQNFQSLMNLGFEIEMVTMDSLNISKVDILVIADPKTDFNESELNALQLYLDGGGNLLLTLESDYPESLSSILNGLRIYPKRENLIQSSDTDLDKNFILGHFFEESPLLPNNWITPGIIKYKSPVTMPGAFSFTYDSISETGFKIDPFIVYPEVPTGGNDRKVNKPIVASLSRNLGNREQRIFVACDADFLSDREMSRKNISNINDYGLVPFLFHWLSGNEFPVDVTKSKSPDDTLYLSKKEGKDVWIIQLVYIGVFPGMLLALGSILLISRKRR